MKPIAAAIFAVGLTGGYCAAVALPGSTACAATVAARIQPVRLVCNDRHCRHVGDDHRYWYRPYGYYRPYRGQREHIGAGPLGVGVF